MNNRLLSIQRIERTYHPGLAEIPAPDGSKDVMSQLKDYPLRQ